MKKKLTAEDAEDAEKETRLPAEHQQKKENQNA